VEPDREKERERKSEGEGESRVHAAPRAIRRYDTAWRECNERRWGVRIRGAAKGEKGADGATATAALP